MPKIWFQAISKLAWTFAFFPYLKGQFLFICSFFKEPPIFGYDCTFHPLQIHFSYFPTYYRHHPILFLLSKALLRGCHSWRKIESKNDVKKVKLLLLSAMPILVVKIPPSTPRRTIFVKICKSFKLVLRSRAHKRMYTTRNDDSLQMSI